MPTRGAYLWPIRVVVTIYVVWLLVRPPHWLDPGLHAVWRWPQLQIHELIGTLLGWIGCDAPSRFLQFEAYFLLMALILPWIACLLSKRGRPADTGWRRPNRLLLRIVGCSLLVSIPFLAWMVRSPEFLPYYQPYLQAGALRIIVYYVVVLFCEHFFFEGVMLAAFRADGRWPNPAKVVQNASTRGRRIAQWFGIAQTKKERREFRSLMRWLGIPDGCVGAVILSGTLFGLVHWGKAGREFFLAFPGGVFLAFLAYRCNSWHAPYLLHAGTFVIGAILFSILYV